MNFSDKLTALLTLTAAKSTELAEALGLGRPYVSRLKTGSRKMPSNMHIVLGMAEFFAKRCEDDYRRNGLYKFTSDPRLNPYGDTDTLVEVIFDWLTGTTQLEGSPAGHFLSSFVTFSQDSIPAGNPTKGNTPLQTPGILLYYKNEGKRQALKDMMAYVDSLNEPCTVRLFTDEVNDWLIEDDAFTRSLNASLSRQAATGIVFERIQPPFNSVEFNFSVIERWMAGYMAGAIQQYYYPWPRDKLHRRTLFVVPGHIALYSHSLYGQREAPVTELTRDPGIVNVCNQEYEAIMKRCRPAMSTFSADSERLYIEAEAVAAIEDAGIYKTSSLSVNTLPPEIIERIRRHNAPIAHRISVSFERRSQSRATVLLKHTITDIMHLPQLDNILAGKEPIPGTQAMPDGALYYTPKEYQAHLERILWHLDAFPNYRAVLLDDPINDNVIVYVKGDSRALLIKQAAPFAAFDITERTMAAAFCDYLGRIAEEKITVGTRQATIQRLKEELQRLSAAMR